MAPGDTIDLRGPDVAADQAALGISWDYQWTVRMNDASGSIVLGPTTISSQTLSFPVPATGYANNYYVDLMVTAHQAQLCVNEACMTFPIAKPGDCTIQPTTTERQKICVNDETTQSGTYSTVATPSQALQRWWIFPPGVAVPATLTYAGNEAYRVADASTSTITVNWKTKANGISGVYVVVSGYFGKKTPYTFQGSCQKQVNIVAVPLSTIQVQ